MTCSWDLPLSLFAALAFTSGSSDFEGRLHPWKGSVLKVRLSGAQCMQSSTACLAYRAHTGLLTGACCLQACIQACAYGG